MNWRQIRIYKITSADMYQLFAYGKKYGSDNKNLQLALIYPKNSNFGNKLEPFLL
jgi:5-methylcytosine-specific restriction enzyme subunit McrC